MHINSTYKKYRRDLELKKIAYVVDNAFTVLKMVGVAVMMYLFAIIFLSL